MLLTLDLNTLFEVLLDEFGEHLELDIDAMTEEEREWAEDRSEPITRVATRFVVEDLSVPESPRRREDLEQRIVQLGRK